MPNIETTSDRLKQAPSWELQWSGTFFFPTGQIKTASSEFVYIAINETSSGALMAACSKEDACFCRCLLPR